MRLLIVEDDDALGQGLRSQLASQGYAVDLATDGIDGGSGAGLGRAESNKLLTHLGGGPGAYTLCLNGSDQRIVTTHEAGSADPTNLGLDERRALAPRLDTPLVHDRVERGLDLAVCPVATESAAVRRTREDGVQAMSNVVLGAQLSQRAEQPLDAPQ